MDYLLPEKERPSTSASALSARSHRSAQSQKSNRSFNSDTGSGTGSAYRDDPGYRGECWIATSMRSSIPWASNSIHRKPAKVMEAPNRTDGRMTLICNPSYVGHVRGKHCE